MSSDSAREKFAAMLTLFFDVEGVGKVGEYCRMTIRILEGEDGQPSAVCRRPT